MADSARRGRLGAVVVTGAILLVSAGTAVGLTIAPTRAPEAIDPSSGPVTVEAATTSFDDQRPTTVIVVPARGSRLTSPVSGLVTSSDCRPGEAVASGSSPFSVDDQPMIALSTSRPIWRPLGPGDTGPDVRALQEELNRLGQATAVDGVVGAQTLRAARAVAAAAGRDVRDWEAVPAEAILWLPADPATIDGCSVRPGDRVDVGDELATLPAAIAAARVGSDAGSGTSELSDASGSGQPGDASASGEPGDASGLKGARDVVVDGEVFRVGPDGSLPVADLGRLAGTPLYAAALQQAGAGSASAGSASADGATITIAAQSRLAEPVPAWRVPPAALYDIRGTESCVLSDGRPLAVTILGSRLGETFVSSADGTPLRRLRLQPGSAEKCG